jgi:hypothetical protein
MNLADPSNYGNAPGQGPLRPGGMAPPQGGMLDENNLPSTPSKSAKAQAEALGMCRDLEAGPLRIRERGVTYLPKAPGESHDSYQSRLNRSVFFNVFGHTVKGLTGFVFRKDPKLGDDVPKTIAGTETEGGHWENIDLAGTHGDVFCRDLMHDALVAGHAAILVEYPATGGTQSAAEEMEIRPYWVPIKKDNIISWRTTIEKGRTLLNQVVLKEVTMVPDGAFGEKVQERYRVLYRENGVVGWRLLEVTKDKSVIQIDAGLYGNQAEIPLAEVVTSGRKSMFESEPPLLDLAFLNISHYQQYSDYLTSMHYTSVPIWVTIGEQIEPEDNKRQTLAANRGVALPPGADAKWVAHDGAALASCKQALDDIKSDMAALGLAMMASQKRAAETAESKRIDKAGTDSQLSATARGLQDGIERALGFHANYLKEKDGGSIQINRDFEAWLMESDVMAQYVAAVEAGFDKEMAIRMLQLGGRIPEDADPETLALEWEARSQAVQEAKRLEMEEQGERLSNEARKAA